MNPPCNCDICRECQLEGHAPEPMTDATGSHGEAAKGIEDQQEPDETGGMP